MKTEETIERYLAKKQLFRSKEHEKLESLFLIKSRKNFSVANIMLRISEQENIKKMLSISTDFETYDWVIIVSYYAMYTSALAAISKLGFRSKSHAATVEVLKKYYLSNKNDRALQPTDIQKLRKAYALSEEFIIKLLQTKTNRETAQYDATPAITREMAKTSINDAREFIEKVEEILAKA